MPAPLVPWDNYGAEHADLVWTTRLDERYQIEVHRTGSHTAKLVMYDHQKQDAEIASWDVGLAYGAVMGPDTDDVATWQDKCADFVDNAYQGK